MSKAKFPIEQADPPRSPKETLPLAKIKYHRSQEPPKPFGVFIEELIADIPQDVLDTLPTDSAEQHDHYIYGTPKHNP